MIDILLFMKLMGEFYAKLLHSSKAKAYAS
jgi:hypothetical protein